MKIKLLAVGLGLVLLCAVIVALQVLLPPPEPPAGRIAASGASQRSARSVVSSSTRRAGPDPAEPITGLPDQAPPAAPPPAPPLLTPDQETARLRKILDDSGIAAGDALDRSSHDIASDLVAQLRSHDAAVTLQALECRAAGCTATLELAAEADYVRWRDLFHGIDSRSPVGRWPGPRIMPPPVHRDGKLFITLMMIRPDSRARFQ